MKRILSKAVYVLISVTLFFPSCGKPESNQDSYHESPEDVKPIEQIVTGEASNITEFTVTIKSDANPTPEMGDVLLGVLLSENEEITIDNSINATSQELDSNNKFSVEINNLKPQTIYYYKSYIKYGGIFHFGEEKSFSTLRLETTIETGEVTDLTETAATFHGRLISPPRGHASIMVMFIISTFLPDEEGYKNSKIHYTSLQEDGTFSITIQSLPAAERLYYTALAEINGITIRGESLSFTTPGEPPLTEARENANWQVSYEGRKVVDGSYVEEIRVNNVPAEQQYLVSIINKANYSSYGGDLLEFFKYELAHNSDYVYQGSPAVIQCERFRHGTWYAFVIGLNKNKELTGEYAYCMFTVEEEAPSAEYLSWLGNWTVSDGNISYNIKVSKIEANNVYRIDGWEVRNDTYYWVQMNQEYLEAFFEPANGRLYFVSQYITSYYDESLDGATVDELFLGLIKHNGSTYIVPTEGIDLAYAQHDDEELASVRPCSIKIDIDNDTFEGNFSCMQYVYQEVQNGNWHFYNKESISLLRNVTMVKTKGEANIPRSTVMLRGKAHLTSEDKPLRGIVYEPRAGRVIKGIMFL